MWGSKDMPNYGSSDSKSNCSNSSIVSNNHSSASRESYKNGPAGTSINYPRPEAFQYSNVGCGYLSRKKNVLNN